MMIARGSGIGKNDKPTELLILGLTDKNIMGLVKGKPMRITRETHGDGVPEGWAIMIFRGKDEEDCAQMLREANVIGPETKVVVDPKLNQS